MDKEELSTIEIRVIDTKDGKIAYKTLTVKEKELIDQLEVEWHHIKKGWEVLE